MATPRGMVTHRTADDEIGGRLELDTAWGRLGLLAGVGYGLSSQFNANIEVAGVGLCYHFAAPRH